MPAKRQRNQTMQKQISAGFAVRCANGSRKKRVAGGVRIQTFPNTFTRLAARVGIRLKPAGDVRAALTCGAGRAAFGAEKILRTKIGIQ